MYKQVNLIKDPGYIRCNIGITVGCLAFNLVSQVTDHVTYPQTRLAKYPLMCIRVCHLYPFGVVLCRHVFLFVFFFLFCSTVVLSISFRLTILIVPFDICNLFVFVTSAILSTFIPY